MKPKDRDFIETTDGHLFCVVGYLHPPDGYTAYLKYIPSVDGKWGKEGARYTRTLPFYHVSQVENTYRYLKENYPQYLYDCPVRNITLSWIPKTSVKHYYQPVEKLNQIRSRGANDALEQKLLDLRDVLSGEAGTESLGVTGSILTGIHNPEFSDIDLTVYGHDASMKVKEALVKLKGEADVIQPIPPIELERWVNNRAERFPLNVNDLHRIARKRWNYGYIDGTYFSVHPTRTDNEITETYGDNTYQRLGYGMGNAKITDASNSIYLPAKYSLRDVELETGDEEIEEIVSYEGLYGGVFEEGDRIEFKGVIEEVKGKDRYLRLVVGGAGSTDGYIRWM
ncbi:MAG: nucleotidyltransferase domain-containing protein [Candidatus Bathyarchaeota archaeon]|nr:nucleotidyltransferase domain-containing protein [Candidatus Bathyarchaeota archaeon]